MDTNEALKRLFKIASTQQEVLRRLAQAVGAVPAQVPAQTLSGEDLTPKVQEALFAAHPEAKTAVVDLTVGSPDAGGKVIFVKYHADNPAAKMLKQWVQEAGNAVIGAGQFSVQTTGMFG